jgi:hypothetical protein
MHMVGHDFKTKYLCPMLLAHFMNELNQSFCYGLNQDLASVLGAPDHMVLAGVIDMSVGLVGYLAHRASIQL